MRIKFWLALALVGALSQAVAAEEVILRITGNLVKPAAKADVRTQFTLKDLQALPQLEFKATTAFTGTASFKGPLLRDVLKTAGASPDAKHVLAIAIDGYRVKIPISDFSKYEVIAAQEMNGKTLKPESRGPIWIMYPLDQYPKELSTPATETRLVWSLKELRVD